MKTSTLLKSALSIVLVSSLIFSCKKKDDTAPEEDTTTTTGGTTGGTTTPTVPSNGLTVNQFQIGTTTYSAATLGWQSNGYSGYSAAGIQHQFKAIFSSKGPVSGTYSVINVANAGTTVSANEIGIYVLENYFQKPVTSNTGTVTVTNNNGKVTILVNDVTMGTQKFNAHYVIGDDNRFVYVGNNSLDPEYANAVSIAEYSNVHRVKIETYGSQLSDYEDWGFNFYFGATGLNDGTYTSISQPSLLQNIPAGNVYLIADNSATQYKSTATSGSVSVSGNKITFNNFVITTASSQTVSIRGVYQF